MIIKVYLSDFENAFKTAGRGDQFSRPALEAMFNHLEALEEDSGSPIELDVIALCCDFVEVSKEDTLELENYNQNDIVAELGDTILFAQ